LRKDPRPSFSVFVDGDPRSIRQLDTDTKKQAFLERAPVRPGNPGHFRERQYSNEQVSREPLEEGSRDTWLKTGERKENETSSDRNSGMDTDSTPVPAQKIESETPSREHVVRVQTAMNHLTVIEWVSP